MLKLSKLVIGSCGLLLLGGSAFASTLYENALPNTFVNSQNANLRSNIAFTESDPTTEFDGTDVELSTGALGQDEYQVTTLTTWSVASVLGQPLGDEFSSISLYYRPLGGTWQVLETGSPGTSFETGPLNQNTVSNSNPDIISTNVGYTALQPDYESTTSTAEFPLWQNTFNITSLNLVLDAGVVYQFAVWGVGANPDPTTDYGFWFNAYSNGSLSGAREDANSQSFAGTYERCSLTDLSGPCEDENSVTSQTWNKTANLNIDIEGFAVPEPSTFVLLGLGLLGLVGVGRKRLS